MYVYAFLELFQELDLQQIRIIFVRKTESDCLYVHMVNEGGNNINLGLWYIVVIAENNIEHLMIIHI